MCGTTRQTLFVEMGFEKQRRKGQSSIGRERDQEGQPSDLFSAMLPVESVKALVSYVMSERVDKRGRILVFAVCSTSIRAHFH